jgi:hypothetical protein
MNRIIAGVDANNVQSLILYAYHKFAALHVGNAGYIADEIISFLAIEAILETFHFFPVAPSFSLG